MKFLKYMTCSLCLSTIVQRTISLQLLIVLFYKLYCWINECILNHNFSILYSTFFFLQKLYTSSFFNYRKIYIIYNIYINFQKITSTLRSEIRVILHDCWIYIWSWRKKVKSDLNCNACQPRPTKKALTVRTRGGIAAAAAAARFRRRHYFVITHNTTRRQNHRKILYRLYIVFVISEVSIWFVNYIVNNDSDI